MPKQVTLKKLKELEVESYLDSNEFKCWRYTNAPKELIPTDKDVGKLVRIAREPGTKDYYKNYRIRAFTGKKDDPIIELIGDNGYLSKRLQDVVLSNEKFTPEEKLIKEHKGKKSDGRIKRNRKRA